MCMSKFSVVESILPYAMCFYLEFRWTMEYLILFCYYVDPDENDVGNLNLGTGINKCSFPFCLVERTIITVLQLCDRCLLLLIYCFISTSIPQKPISRFAF